MPFGNVSESAITRFVDVVGQPEKNGVIDQLGKEEAEGKLEHAWNPNSVHKSDRLVVPHGMSVGGQNWTRFCVRLFLKNKVHSLTNFTRHRKTINYVLLFTTLIIVCTSRI